MLQVTCAHMRHCQSTSMTEQTVQTAPNIKMRAYLLNDTRELKMRLIYRQGVTPWFALLYDGFRLNPANGKWSLSAWTLLQTI